MSKPATTDHPGPVKLEEFIAINREIAALVRAGIPLELGLKTFAGRLPSRLGRLASRIADRLSLGESPATALHVEGCSAYPIYTAVIDAGLQTGRLPEVLEAVAESAEVVQETRRHLQLAFIYPIIVCVLGYLLFLFFAAEIVPRYIGVARDFGFGDDFTFRLLQMLHDTLPIWMWLLPATLVIILMAIRWITGRHVWNPFGLHRLLARAQFAELLKIQIAHGLPITPAFRRAADGAGDTTLSRMADSVCEDVERGISFPTAVSKATTLPPLMRWMLATGAQHGTLVNTLGLMRDSFRRRARWWAQAIQVWLPALFTLVITGSFALLYGLLFFMPLRAFWEGVMRE